MRIGPLANQVPPRCVQTSAMRIPTVLVTRKLGYSAARRVQRRVGPQELSVIALPA